MFMNSNVFKIVFFSKGRNKEMGGECGAYWGGERRVQGFGGET